MKGCVIAIALATLLRAAPSGQAVSAEELWGALNPAEAGNSCRGRTGWKCRGAETLREVADAADQPWAGVAFGLLERMGPPVATKPLETELTEGRTASARETAGAVLGRLPVPEAQGALREALRDPDESVRVVAALALAHWHMADGAKTLEDAAKRNDSGSRIDALVAVAAMGRAWALDEIRSLATSSDEALRGRVVWAIARSGELPMKLFAFQLNLDQSPPFLAMLADKLLDPRDARDLSVLQGALSSASATVRLVAARRLLSGPLRSRAEATIASLLGSGDEPTREFAARLASEDSHLWPTLAAQLSNTDPEVETAAIVAAVNLHDTGRFEEIEHSLEAESRTVSLAAAEALISLDPKAARPVFEQHLTSSTGFVRLYSSAMLLTLAQRGQAAVPSPTGKSENARR